MIIIRYADDFIVGFQHREEAQRYLDESTKRFAEFGLELNAKKTRLLEFGRLAASSWTKRGKGKPETFNFLGFTHACGKDRKGWFRVRRWTCRKALTRKLRQVYQELRKRMHDPVPLQGKYLASVVRGHSNYYGIAGNSRLIRFFRQRVSYLWRKTLSRRSQKGNLPWKRINRLIAKFLPPARLRYTHPDGYLSSSIRGRSPVR